jgi:hypothetical protein
MIGVGKVTNFGPPVIASMRQSNSKRSINGLAAGRSEENYGFHLAKLTGEKLG